MSLLSRRGRAANILADIVKALLAYTFTGDRIDKAIAWLPC